MTGFAITALPCAVASRIARAFKLRSLFFYAAAGAIVSFLAQLVLATIITWSPLQWYTFEPQSFDEQLRGVLHSLWTVGPVFSLRLPSGGWPVVTTTRASNCRCRTDFGHEASFACIGGRTFRRRIRSVICHSLRRLTVLFGLCGPGYINNQRRMPLLRTHAVLSSCQSNSNATR